MPSSGDVQQRGGAAFLARAIGWTFGVAGAVGLLAAVTLSVEKIRLLEDPGYIPSCSINPILSCGSVMSTPQAEAFGIPNPLLGIAGFAALTALGVALVAGATFPRWLWLAIQLGITFAVGFVHWLFFQSVYRIDALCPYCMVVWVVTIVVFVHGTLRNVAEGVIRLPAAVRPAADLAVRNHGVILTVWFTTLAVLIGEAFWYYWRTLL